jgi:ATP-dependent helicase/nuclease subunit A
MPQQGDAPRGVSGYELWRTMEEDEDLAELNRLLYVATTRAADYLVLSSGVTQLGAAKGPWLQLLARRFDLVTGKLIGSLPADEPAPKVRVTIEAPQARGSAAAVGGRGDLEKLIAQLGAAHRGNPVAMPAIEPVAIDRSARRQYSFSRLSGLLHARDAASFDDAGELDAEVVDPLGLGTLVHAVLAAIDIASPGDIDALVARHAERQLLGADSALAFEARMLVERFLNSPRAGELARAKRRMAEAEFMLAWPPGAKGEDRILLTGYIDQLYQDAAGRWHVLDFKTNRVSKENLAAVVASYEMQMLVYALATERILGQAPESLSLHFLRTASEHSFAWNDAARARALELVNSGIAAATATTAGGMASDSAYAREAALL